MGNLLTDPATADELKTLLVKANQSVDELQVTLNNLQQASTNLPAISDAVGKEAKDLPGLVLQTQVSMREVERLVEAMQKTWLLRKYVNPTNPPPLNPLSEPAVPETKPVKSPPFAEGFCKLSFKPNRVSPGNSQKNTFGLHLIASSGFSGNTFGPCKKIYDQTCGNTANSCFPKNASPIAAESQSSHPKPKVSKAGQHFFQIPRHARGSWHAPDENNA